MGQLVCRFVNLLVKQWFEHDCYVKMVNTWRLNRLPCDEIISTMRTRAILRHKSVHRSAQIQRQCYRTWWREISSMYCQWWWLVDGLIGCFRDSWQQKCRFHWHYDLSQCCSVALSWPHLMLPGCPVLHGISWMFSVYGASTLWFWEKIMVRNLHIAKERGIFVLSQKWIIVFRWAKTIKHFFETYFVLSFLIVNL